MQKKKESHPQIPMFPGKYHQHGGCSIAMLIYRSANLLGSFDTSLKQPDVFIRFMIFMGCYQRHSLKLTWHNPWKLLRTACRWFISFWCKRPIARGENAVSFREGISNVCPWKQTNIPWKLMLGRWSFLKNGPFSASSAYPRIFQWYSRMGPRLLSRFCCFACLQIPPRADRNNHSIPDPQVSDGSFLSEIEGWFQK